VQHARTDQRDHHRELVAGYTTAGSTLYLQPHGALQRDQRSADVTGTVVLVGGPSTAIRRDLAAGAMRILEVASTGTLRIHGIFILNGATPAGEPGGAIQNGGALTLAQVTLSGHTTNIASGGALNNTGRAVVIRTLISGNIADGSRPAAASATPVH